MFGQPSGPGNKDQMHPSDLRNVILFFVLASLLYFAYDSFILKPQRDALKAQRLIEAQQKQQNPEKFAAGEQKPEEPEYRPRTDILQESERITLDNPKLFGSISLKGARLDDISLHEHTETLKGEDNVTILSPRGSKFSRLIEHGWVADSKTTAVPDKNTSWQVAGNSTLRPGAPVTLIWENPQGLRFERQYSIDERYMITITQRVINNSAKAVTLHPYGLISQRGTPEGLRDAWIAHEGPIGYIGEELHEINYGDLSKNGAKSFTATQGWAGVTSKYWLNALIPPQGSGARYRYSASGQTKNIKESLFQIDYTGAALEIPAGSDAEISSRLFSGAKEVLVLEDYEKSAGIPKFNLAVNFGWFWFFSKPFFYALHFLHELIGNMGFAIILLTIAIRTAVFPLTNASYRSFAKMKKVSPQIAKIREAHKDDKKKMQEALVELYQREGVNPMAGCVPMLLQIPIFFALYKVLYVTIEMRHAPFVGWIHDLSVADPTNVFTLFGLIPWDPPAMMHIGIWPLCMMVAMLIQKQLNPPPQDKLQRDMATYFPFFLTFIMAKFAAGLVIYWTVSATIGVIQQIINMRMMGVPIHLFGESEDEEAIEKSVAGGADAHPQYEMIEDEVEEALFGSGEGDDDTPPQKPIKPPKPKKSKKRK